jgi:hypothetical protein
MTQDMIKTIRTIKMMNNGKSAQREPSLLCSEPLDTLNAPAAAPIAAAPVSGGLAAGNNEQQNNERI